MATPVNFARDWVYNVTKPFYKQLKNRLGNIRIEKQSDETYKFFNENNEATDVGRSFTEFEDRISRGVVSGSGTLNPNPYFSRGDLDYKTYLENYPATASIVHDNVTNSSGSLQCKNFVNTLLGDTYCPMPKDLEYKASIDVKVSKDGAKEDGSFITFYLGTISFDSDRDPIYPQNIGYVNTSGTTAPNKDPMIMELSRDLTGLDVYFTFKTGSINKVINTQLRHFRVVKFHKKQVNGEYSYVGTNGRVYDHLGMSKDMKYNGWAVLDNSKADSDPLKYIIPTGVQVDGKDEYRLKLTSALEPRNANISYKAGDVFLQSYGGGTYSYWLSSVEVPINNKWNHFDSSWFLPKNYDGMNQYGQYRNGTAEVKLMMLPNYYYNDGSGSRYLKNSDKIVSNYGNIALLKRNV